MRIECESCKQLVVASFAIDGGSVRATCPACNTTMTAITAAASAEPALAVERCPKCGTAQSGEPACPSCGLTADRMAAFAAARDGEVPAQVRAGWDRVIEGWDDPARHEELIRLIAIHNCYAWAAGRYRDAARSRKGDPIVDRQLERLRRAAEATMLASAAVRRDPASKPYRGATAILVMLVIAIAAGVLYAMVIRERGESRSGEATPAPPVRPLVPARPMHPSTQMR